MHLHVSLHLQRDVHCRPALRQLHFKVEQRALQVLCRLLPALVAEGGELQQEGVVRSLWGVVRLILQASTHFKTQDACTVCAGSVVALMLREGGDSGDLGAAV